MTVVVVVVQVPSVINGKSSADGTKDGPMLRHGFNYSHIYTSKY
jgi:hypothetical protein